MNRPTSPHGGPRTSLAPPTETTDETRRKEYFAFPAPLLARPSRMVRGCRLRKLSSFARYTIRFGPHTHTDRKSTRLNSSHGYISYAVFCLKNNSRERRGINTILHELNPLFTINVTMRDIKSKNVYSRVTSKATTQWRKTESANGVHLEGVASDNRSS